MANEAFDPTNIALMAAFANGGGGGGGGATIDDNTISTATTWSSSKINTEIQSNLILDVTNIGV